MRSSLTGDRIALLQSDITKQAVNAIVSVANCVAPAAA